MAVFLPEDIAVQWKYRRREHLHGYPALVRKLQAAIDTPIGGLSMEIAVTDEPVPFAERLSLSYRPVTVGESWGRLFSCAWFHLTGRVDPSVTEPVFLHLDLNGEALLFDPDGTPVKGFTNGSSAFGFMGSLGDPGKYYCPLNDFIGEDGQLELWLDAGMNDLFGNVKDRGRIRFARMVTRNMDIRRLYYDVDAVSSLMAASVGEDRESFDVYRRGLARVNRTLRHLDSESVRQALDITAELLRTSSKLDHDVSSISHAHLDLAWLWPLRETCRKGARTFANILRLMEEYGDFRFGASQAQLYQWMKDQYPGLYEQVKRRVAEGRWEVQGGMWVESDTNVTGEESLVRQMLYGIRFFEKEFGIRVKNLWLPDVFGYSGNMPQIIRKSGLDYFMTIKISWNDTNTFPHHSFNWEGIDGSTVFAHMPPEGEYNSPANSYFLLKSARNYREKHIDNRTLNLFGIGDGGGGASAAHIERIRRLGGTAPMPRVTMESSSGFFKRLGRIRDRFPTYRGELYLEKHRGTYTSQGRVKYCNRMMERKLKTLETLLVQTRRYGDYKQELQDIWKEVLLYQFHDILPGSSIRRVYDECLERYGILDGRLDAVAAEILGGADDSSRPADELTAFNPLPHPARVRQLTGTEYRQWDIAPLSNTVLGAGMWKKEAAADTRRLENNMMTVSFRRDGSIASIIDRRSGRQILRGAAGGFTVYHDIANAWDIFRHYRLLPHRKMRLVSAEAFRYGPVQEIVQRYRYRRSRLELRVRLEPDNRRIDFEVEADWQDNRRMLRTAFPLNLETEKAVFDIQFGHLERTTKNRSRLERARYEVCGQNWADMSDTTGANWGAAILTDSKYGSRAWGSTLDLHLIKSTNHPAIKGDIGRHRIRYSLFIHSGNHVVGNVDRAAMEFNTWMPVHPRRACVGDAVFELSDDAVSYSTLKQSEDGSDLILRLYERHGRAASCRLKVNRPVSGIFETNMVEENPVRLTSGGELDLEFSPFEVKSLRIASDQEMSG